jgi:phenylalanine-4-hydroxylase
LSEVKEDVTRRPESIRAVESELAEALGALSETSEAARLSRLYWWTAEYGLVGTPKDYKIYGAGLLSSLGESHSCHAPEVRKIVLDESATEVSYDITKPQPQLFVTPDFEALHEVLERVSQGLAFALGGATAIQRAVASGEVASARFTSGAWVIGILKQAGPDLARPAWLRFAGPAAFAWDGVIGKEERGLAKEGAWIVTGQLEGGARLASASDQTLANARDETTGRHRFHFASGAKVEGRLVRHARARDGRLAHLSFTDARLELPGHVPVELAEYTLIPAGDFMTAEAGAVDPTYFPETSFPGTRVPMARELSSHDLGLLELYEAAWRAHHEGSAAVSSVYPLVHARLDREFPREWLLRWNLLETLQKLGVAPELAAVLRAELERLEVAWNYEQPIATGLRYLARVASHPPNA